MTDRELLQQALNALISVWNSDRTTRQVETIRAIKARLAETEPPCKTGSQCVSGKCPQCELGEIIPADEEQLKRIAKLVEPQGEE
jgi:hypothetical protein